MENNSVSVENQAGKFNSKTAEFLSVVTQIDFFRCFQQISPIANQIGRSSLLAGLLVRKSVKQSGTSSKLKGHLGPASFGRDSRIRSSQPDKQQMELLPSGNKIGKERLFIWSGNSQHSRRP